MPTPPPPPAEDRTAAERGQILEVVDESDVDIEVVEESPPDPAKQPRGSTEFAGHVTDEGKGRVFPCGQCGADLLFHIGTQRMKCEFCNHEQDVAVDESAGIVEQDLRAMLEDLRKKHDEGQESFEGFQEVRCDSCGGDVVFSGTLTSRQCPYCASPIQVDGAHQVEQRIAVDGVMPFQVTQQQAEAALKRWVKSLWFAPTRLKRQGIKSTFNGVYLPYWTFDAMTASTYSGQRGEYYYVTTGTGKNKRRSRRTRWYPASGSFQRFFDDVLIVASNGVKRALVRKLEPWPLDTVAPYNQQMVAGFLARTYDVELPQGFDLGKERIEQAIHADVVGRIGGDTQRVESINTKYGALTFKHLLMPVWLLAYRFKDKPYQVVINAATGEVQGERPWSMWKITLAGLGIVALLIVFWLIFGGSAIFR
ncbi:hypothetical protein [Stratiformator vulcanicus]|uniref:DNA-directed RNA polymerase subunit P n=1 Tax=Stratiformator vulcanicus TaxID=2527980 RepID=A0A517R733_9PLAN|nr:hypothetical protein [Stratiformator vulcanicus]QDT39685.1 hypothetical protein Pan189_40940 [Stratiformator vulcanicus]